MLARLATFLTVATATTVAGASSHHTKNFVVRASTPALAATIAEEAERYRHDLALEWLGAELPPWDEPCRILAYVGPQHAPTGETRFRFVERCPVDWKMALVGPLERILDSVLPHEVMHTILATHFGRQLPRWADEGICSSVEHPSQRHKQHRMLERYVSSAGPPFVERLLMADEYPSEIASFYVAGHGLSSFLIARRGKRQYLRYVREVVSLNEQAPDSRIGNWTAATRKHYGFETLASLEHAWLQSIHAMPREPEPRLAQTPTFPATTASAEFVTTSREKNASGEVGERRFPDDG